VSNVTTTLVVSATRPTIQVTVTDRNGQPVDLTSATAVPRLQGKSGELPSVTLDAAGVIVTPAQGRVDFSNIATLVTHANLSGAGIDAATFTCRVKWFDSTGKFDFGDPFYVRFEDTPI
jgi:hypothetical protein